MIEVVVFSAVIRGEISSPLSSVVHVRVESDSKFAHNLKGLMCQQCWARIHSGRCSFIHVSVCVQSLGLHGRLLGGR